MNLPFQDESQRTLSFGLNVHVFGESHCLMVLLWTDVFCDPTKSKKKVVLTLLCVVGEETNRTTF